MAAMQHLLLMGFNGAITPLTENNLTKELK